MLILVPTLLGPQNADPLSQLRVLLASSSALQAEVRNGGDRGTLLVAADGSVRVTTATETLLHSADGDWEIDHESRIYDRMPPAGPLQGGRIGTGRLTPGAQALLVSILIRRGTDGILDRTFRRDGSSYVATLGDARLQLTFGKDRSLSGVTFTAPTGGISWQISGLRSVTADPSKFRTGIPTGYSEAFEPGVPDSLRIGSDLPAKFSSLAPEGAKSWLLAILEPGTEPSERARQWLGTLKARLPVALLENASDDDRNTLVAPDSPTYILVRGGKVLGVWIGHAPGEEKRMEEEMSEAAENSDEEAGS